MTGEYPERESRVFDAARHDASGVKAPGHGDRTVPADPPVAWLQPYYPVVRRWPQDVSCSLGVQGGEAHARGHGYRRTAAGASRGMVKIPGIAGGRGIVGGELGTRRFAEDDSSRGFEASRGRSTVLGNEASV